MAAVAPATPVNAASALLDERAWAYPHRIAIVARDAHVTYEALADLSNRVAWVLEMHGCAPGDRVLLVMPDSPELVAALLAVVKLGALAVPLPPGRPVDDYIFYVKDTGARLVLASPELADSVSSATPCDANVTILVAEPRTAVPTATSWWSAVESAPAAREARLVSPDDPALVLYTSGSTGRQKAAVHSHAAVLAAADNVGRDTFGIRAGDRVLSTARLFFAFGLGFGLTMPLAAGATLIHSPTQGLRELAQTVTEQRPTILVGVPSLLDVLLRASTSWLRIDLSPLRFVVSAGEPLPAVVYDGYRNHHGVEVLDGIGSTELLSHFLTNRPGRSVRNSCGTPVHGCEISLLDDDGVPVAEGEVGNLCVKTDSAFLGYWNRPDATACVKDRHGVSTGDKLFRDADGFYHYCGRSDDMLKVAGSWVSPHEIESALRGHPGVERCVVTTRDDRSGRRRLVAYVVPKPSAAVRPSDLYQYVGDRLAQHMIPTAFTLVPVLPLTPNGKVRRSSLPEPEWASSTRDAPSERHL